MHRRICVATLHLALAVHAIFTLRLCGPNRPPSILLTHMRHFDEQLQELLQKLVLMGTTAEGMIELAIRCLLERSETRSADVYRKEDEVNALQVEIDNEAVTLAATHQPVA